MSLVTTMMMADISLAGLDHSPPTPKPCSYGAEDAEAGALRTYTWGENKPTP
jgi:hypothetical protein